MRVFLDANILFSASHPRWHTHGLIQLLLQHCECVTSVYAAEEAIRNVTRHFPAALAGLTKLLSQLEYSEGAGESLDIQLEAKDYPILAAAIGGGATHLLTGDHRHFGHLMGTEVQGVRIVDQARLIEEIVGHGWL